VPLAGPPLTHSDGGAREVRAVLSLPLRGQEDVLGALIASSSSPGSFGKEEVQILSILADQAAIGIEKARLIDDLEQAREALQNSAKKLSQKVKEKTEELKQSQAHLFQSEKLAGIGQLAAGIAHEIRNPLGIKATSLYYLNDVLSEKTKDVKRHFQIIESEINRCEGIISNLLEFSRKSEKELEVIDVNALLNITLSLVEKDLFVKDIKLTKKLEQRPTIRANMDEIKQVFLNLILNATQAMPNGGRLEVATSLTENQRARIKIAGELRFSDTRHSVSDISKIAALGWKPVNSLDKSVGDYVAWLKEEEAIQDLVEYSQKKMKDQGVIRKAKANLKEGT